MFACFENHTIDRINLGRYVMRYTKLALGKAFESLQRDAASFKVEHIRYADTVKNPKGMCRNILAKVGLEYTDEYDKLLDAYLLQNENKRKALKSENKSADLHAYKLEDYGLSREVVEKEFADYISLYNLKEVKSK